ncbi:MULTISPECIES: cytochrome c [Acidobacterium]|uniref:Putative cytochrome c family protein n=1 Tax=Acidobacterium capsulatum (strain ATCC 51196 / DSM 11244 / BCRC 80197 / JCM 7670 / NBRC 15755 / NCIMB 13165 / 161) TaxID=240015 RepID=C1F2N5_ACIC5|nr:MULTISPECIES: cytochrome c [Acidobacterium]ACO34291.1 putative cytochrome c family protein [Acidobacterium capsulatum ATCC 51196]HCT61447.1 cytochrome c [Acidobacterium sp.]
MKLLLVMFACMLPVLGFGPVQQSPAAGTQSAPAVPGADVVNPVKPTAASQAEAKKIYSWDCAMCHGDNGNGKGDLAVSEKLTLPDYREAAALKGVTDGQMFYAIRHGLGQMPPEDPQRANDETVWNLVIYLRSLSKPPAP